MAAPRTPYKENIKSITVTATGSTYLNEYDSGVVFVSNTTTHSIMLPPVASSAGVRFQFCKVSTHTLAITLDANGSETINGAATYASMDAAYDSAEVVCNGSAWFVVDAKIA